MAKPDWQSQNYKKVNPVQKAAAGTLALGGLLAYGAKKAFDAFKNRKKDSDTSATTGIDISKDIKARNKTMPVTPQQRKENQKAIQDIVDSQEVKFVENTNKPKRKIKNPYRYAPQKTTRKITKEELDKKVKESNKQFDYQVKKNQQVSSSNQGSSSSSSSSVEPPKEVKKNQTTTTTGKTRSNNRSIILNDAASRTGKKNSDNKKPEVSEAAKKRIMNLIQKAKDDIAAERALAKKKGRPVNQQKLDRLNNIIKKRQNQIK